MWDSLVNRNKTFVRSIFDGEADRHGFMCKPSSRSIPRSTLGDYTLSSQPVEAWLPIVVDNYKREVKALKTYGDDNIPLARLSTATHLFGKAFGCDIHVPPDDMPCALPFVKNAAEADTLMVPDLWKTECLYRVFELGNAVREELGRDVDLGICDLQTGFDIANLIWDKSDMLCAMLLDPDAVKRLSAKCALLLKTFLVELRKEFPTMSPCHCPATWVPPELGPWVSNDEVGTMSVEMFEEFCLPELNDLSETFGGVATHCCADAEHQFPGFNKTKNFYGFNRVSDKRGYLPILEHFGGPNAPVHCLGWISDENTEQLISRAPAGTRFIFVNMNADDDAAAEWLARGRALSAKYFSGAGTVESSASGTV